jgi:4-aminobutyrate aminotransferase-like enzyme
MPLVITEEQLDEGLTIIEESIKASVSELTAAK